MSNKTAPVAAIVVAAGSGSRLGYPIPKALVEVAGVPLVRRAVDSLVEGGVSRVVVVAPDGHLELCASLLADVAVPVDVVVGGAERQDSVRLGLAAVAEADVVLVHDAARPLVPAHVVADVVERVRGGARAVVPVLPVVDSIRAAAGEGSRVVDRAGLRAVQTPQGFDGALLRDAHAHALAAELVVTDDASACEALGEPVTFVTGHREALKITDPFDLLVAEAILRTRE
ncbi:MAG: 2-C-methyl-D-erythritol 4-phosphate cytidylyltransferase [Propionibacterium sp.]|nr:2-C-methyl-D-erythritol 4-phosphate cytidylyltransferase [Propionibacterium sp.]